jgi:hypothetical protein
MDGHLNRSSQIIGAMVEEFVMSSSFGKYSVFMLLIGLVFGYLLASAVKNKEGFNTQACPPSDNRAVCPPCREPDLSKYVLRSSVPPCPAQADLSKYMLKTECPPVPDLSNYVLKSSVPRQQPVVLDCSKCSKSSGSCPPCPRARCPEVKCPAPTTCPTFAPCPRTQCPQPIVKCRAEDNNSTTGARPYLAPLDVAGFG